jgi:hypothetical protein
MAKKSNILDLIRTAGKQAKVQAVDRIEQEQILSIETPETDDTKKKHIYNILDYIESSWGLGMKPYPVQRFIIKLYYNMPLDSSQRNIHISDMFNTRTLYKFNEKEYLNYLFNEGRCNIKEQDHDRKELVLPIGRRGGKTTLSGIFASYEVYKLLNLVDPQAYYGLPRGNRIQLISVATDKDQASLLFNEVSTHLNVCDYFTPYIANNTQTYIQFRTPADIDKYGATKRQDNGKFVTFNGKATVRVTFKSSVAKGLRGAGNIVVVLDEMAHFADTAKGSAKEIYDAVTPSTAAFSPKDPNDSSKPIGPVESRIICISSPLNRTGKFYELYQQAMSGGPAAANMLAIQASTWEVNPTIPTSYYKQKYHADPAVFMVEHGANFSDRVRGWIERENDLTDCIDNNLRPQPNGIPRYPHYMGIDLGLVDDGTCVVITALSEGKIYLVYHEHWVAGVDWRESNPHLGTNYSTDYARSLSTVTRLDFEEISNWIFALTKRFYIKDAIFDRWNGIPLEQNLVKRGLSQFKSEFFTRDFNSRIYQNAKMMLFDKGIVLYDYPTQGKPNYSPLIKELLSLQAEQVSRNLVVVAAPEQPGFHDDMSDAFVRSIWLAAQDFSTKHVTKGSGGYLSGSRSQASSLAKMNSFHKIRSKFHGVDTRRQIPRGRNFIR